MRSNLTAPRQRTGFTLVELLVVIAIIGILASMLMPAINSARESARSTQCGSNSRNLAMACNSYSSQNREMLPALTGNTVGSGFVELMPYLEMGNLYDSLSGDNPATSFSTRLPIFMCPSGTDQQTAGLSHFVMCVGTRMDYATNFGDMNSSDGDNANAWQPAQGDATTGLGADGLGAFGSTAQSMASMARDGASNTILYSEKSDGGRVMAGDSMNTLGFHAGKTPNQDYASIRQDPTAANHAHSSHPGGVNTAFGDAHIQFVSKDIAPNTWKALSTAQGGEPIVAGSE